MKFPFLALVAVLLATLLPPLSPAQAQPQAEAARGAPPLAKFMIEDKPMRLRNASGEFSLTVPLAKRARMKSAMLHLELTNSIALLKERSQLAIRLNGHIVAQLPLNALQPESSADIRLPGQLFKPGYNKLTFEAAQHYTFKCEDPSAPELWSEIDTTRSTLALETELLPLSPRLSELADLFDPKMQTGQGLQILTPAATVTPDELRWGALVAQGAALRMQYAPLPVRHIRAAVSSKDAAAGRLFPGLDQAQLASGDSALIGVKAALAPFLSKRILDGITDSFVGVYPLDADPRRVMLVISGRTAEEVSRAAESFGLLSCPFPDTESMTVSRIEWPQIGPYSGRGRVQENHEYKLADLGFRTTTVKGVYGEDMAMEVNVPADLYAAEDAEVELLLHLAYGAGMRKDSVLNLFVNDHFEGAIPLADEKGGVFRKYKLSLPLRSLRPGLNRIAFSARLMPQLSGECQMINTENLVLSLFDDSILRVPKASHFVSMPNLRLFSRSGFPYLVQPDGEDLFVNVAGKDSDTISAAWMLFGKLAQRQSLLLQRAKVSFDPPPATANAIMVGTVSRVNPKLLEGAPFGFGAQNRAPYPTLVDSHISLSGQGWWEGLWHGIGSMLEGTQTPRAPETARITGVGGLGRYALGMEYESPLASGKTFLAVMAGDEASLRKNVLRLIQPDIWDQLRGDVSTWRPDSDAVAWQKAGGSYEMGQVNLPTRFSFYFSKYPWLWFAAVLSLVALLAWLTRLLLRRFRRKHHEGARESTPSA